MAQTASHAAEHDRYEVHEVLGGEPTLDLGLRFETPDFGGAVDFAFDYLERRDPGRLASTSIASLVPVVPSLLLVIVTSGIVVALGLLLNILVERPLLDLCRRMGPRRTAARLIPEMRPSGE